MTPDELTEMTTSVRKEPSSCALSQHVLDIASQLLCHLLPDQEL